jgi:uncharacterized membrane protein YhaH (DUF805 family)
MTFLPIVAREMRVSARRPTSYWNRVVAATLALVVGVLVYANFGVGSLPDLGMALFIALAWLAFVFCALAGARLTADSISEERREGTLGLLFLTDLKGYDIVLGKLAASSLAGVYSLLAIVPVLGTTLLFGGVSGRQFGMTVLVLLNTLFCSLAVGSWVSTWFENGRRSMLTTVVLLALLCVGPWIAMWLQGVRDGFKSGPDFTLVTPSPMLAMLVAILPPTAMPAAVLGSIASLFWPSVGSTFGVGVVCFVLSSFAVPRVWQDRPAGSRLERVRGAWSRFKFGVGAGRAALRTRLLGVNPIYWLNARERLKPWLVWIVLALGAALLVWVRFWAPEDSWRDPGFLLTFSQALYGVLKLWIAAAVVVRLAEDRRTGALELLVTVPLTLPDFFAGLRHALQRQFFLPLLVVLLADAWFCWLTMQRDYGSQDQIVAAYAARMSLLALDVITLWRLGPWVAVTARHANQAAAHLLVRVCVLPWLVFLLGTMTIALLDTWNLWKPDLNEWHALAAWFALGLVNDGFWLLYGRRQTIRGFREAAAARYGGGRGWWRRLWRLT